MVSQITLAQFILDNRGRDAFVGADLTTVVLSIQEAIRKQAFTYYIGPTEIEGVIFLDSDFENKELHIENLICTTKRALKFFLDQYLDKFHEKQFTTLTGIRKGKKHITLNDKNIRRLYKWVAHQI